MFPSERLIKLFYSNNLITQSLTCVEHTAQSFSLSIFSCLFCGVVWSLGTLMPAAPLHMNLVFAYQDLSSAYQCRHCGFWLLSLSRPHSQAVCQAALKRAHLVCLAENSVLRTLAYIAEVVFAWRLWMVPESVLPFWFSSLLLSVIALCIQADSSGEPPYRPHSNCRQILSRWNRW